MPAIALVGLVGLLLLAERVYVILVRSRNNGRVFIERIIRLVHGGKIDEAIKQCADSAAALADMGLLILRSRSRDEHALRDIATAASLTVVPRLTRRLRHLQLLAAIAVLLGMLGSILGLRQALLRAGATPHGAPLATGIAASLIPLTFGLGVAILLVLARGYLAGQAQSITEQIQEFSVRLVNALVDRPDVRLGHR